MNPKNTQDELNELNSGLPPAKNPFSMPKGYFEGLAGSILAKIKELETISSADEISQLSPFLADISRKMPFNIPDHYFESTIEELPILISEKDDLTILSSIERSIPYDVPSGYFENLPKQIIAKVSTPKGKVISFERKKWMRFAVAACFIAVISISGFFYIKGKNNSSKDPIAQIKNVSTKDIDDFLKNTGSGLNTALAANNSRTNDIKNMLKDVPDNELDNFLKQVPAEEEELTIN